MSRFASAALLASLSFALVGSAKAADLDYGYDAPPPGPPPVERSYAEPVPVAPRPVYYPAPVYYPPPVVYPRPILYPRPFYRPLYPRAAFGYGPRFGRPFGGYRRF